MSNAPVPHARLSKERHLEESQQNLDALRRFLAKLRGDVDAIVAGTYTDEQCRDVIAAALTDSSTIDFTADDAANTITAIVKLASIGTGHLNFTPATATDISDHAAETAGIHGITDTDRQVPKKIFEPQTVVNAAAAATGNVVLSGLLTIDGVVLTAGQWCLLPYQTDPTEIGLYVVAAGAWTRVSPYANTGAAISRLIVTIDAGGTVNGEKVFANNNLNVPTIGVDDIEFIEVGATALEPDPAAANRMAVDLMYLLYGDLTLDGSVTLNGAVAMTSSLDVNALTAGTVLANALLHNDLGLISDTSGNPTIGLTSADMSEIVHVDPVNKRISTDIGFPFYIHAGGISTTNHQPIILEGGLQLRIREIGNANVTMNKGDGTISFKTAFTTTRTATLPALSAVNNGQRFRIADDIDQSGGAVNGAGTYNISVTCAGSDKFLDGNTTWKLKSDLAEFEVEKRNGKWKPIPIYGTVAP